MIVSFRDKRTAAVFLGRPTKGFPSDLLKTTNWGAWLPERGDHNRRCVVAV
jgi:hypothetical protein